MELMLAPLAGVSDGVFRQIAHEHGCNYACTEMVSAKGLYYKSKETRSLLEINPEKEGRVAIQLFGNDPKIMGWAAKELESEPCCAIDINMGCPVPKVFNNGEGSALLLNKELACSIVERVKESTSKPVTVKMRIGIAKRGEGEHSAYDYVGFAKALEKAGADMIAVHARTREDYYSGHSDWSAIGEIVSGVKIPVAGNGDVRSREDALSMIEQTGCSFVMIGRGAMGNPWIFEDKKPSKEEVIRVVNQHLDLAVARYGEYKAVREARKQISWYTKGIKGAGLLRNKLNSACSKEELRELLKEI